MSKHTAGPWVFGILSWGEGATQEIEEKPFDYSGPGYYANPSIMDKNGTEIVGCDEYNIFSSPENTRLIVAAPDLLDAIENLLWHAEQLEELIESERGKGRSPDQLYAAGEMHAYMVEAKSCIAKARGEA